MPLHHTRSSSGDAPEVYCPPPASPPTTTTATPTLPYERPSYTAAPLRPPFQHLPTPPADHVPPESKPNAQTAIPEEQQYFSPHNLYHHPYPPPGPNPHHYPPPPISPPVSEACLTPSPGYFHDATTQRQYFTSIPPPPPPPPPPISTSPSQPQPFPSDPSHLTYSFNSVNPTTLNVQLSPSYGFQQTTSPQQYFPPPPPSPAPSAPGTHLTCNTLLPPIYFPPPPSPHAPTSSPQTAVPPLPSFPAYKPVQTVSTPNHNSSQSNPSPPPYVPNYTSLQAPSSPMPNNSQSTGTTHHHLTAASTQSLPNPSTSLYQGSANAVGQHDISSSFSNLSLTNSASEATPIPPAADDVAEHWSKRFVGNTLAGRVVRASVKSVAATVQLPTYLSPWGDNNPMTLPNVRRRDATLAVVGHMGMEALAPSAVELTGGVLKFGATQSAEQAADTAIHHVTPAKAAVVQYRDGVCTTQVRIKHRLMGSDANLRYVGGRRAAHLADYSKGWFCPLLFASGRTPSVPRANDFSVAEFTGPGLLADTELVRGLVRLLSQNSVVPGLCSTDPKTGTASSRLLILLMGMSPCRTQAWSQARIPGEARLQLHLFPGISGLVVPVTATAPIYAWSPWTLKQMHGNGGKASLYSPEHQYQELCTYLESVISVEHVESPYRGEHRDMVGLTLWSMIQGALGTKNLSQEAMAAVDTERAGIAMLRY